MADWGPKNPHPHSRMKTELVYRGRYDEYGSRRQMRLATFPLPLQRVETIEEPREAHKAQPRRLGLPFSEEEFHQQAHRDDRRNMLIWSDNKPVMAAQLEQFRGKIDLIYLSPPETRAESGAMIRAPTLQTRAKHTAWRKIDGLRICKRAAPAISLLPGGLIMAKFQAVFEILYFLAAVDGAVHPREIEVIGRFLESNHGNNCFNPLEVAKSISMMTAEGMAEELVNAAVVFKSNSSAADRNTVLDFALQLIAADRHLTESEKNLFFILGDTWNVNMDRYLASRGIK